MKTTGRVPQVNLWLAYAALVLLIALGGWQLIPSPGSAAALQPDPEETSPGEGSELLAGDTVTATATVTPTATPAIKSTAVVTTTGIITETLPEDASPETILEMFFSPTQLPAEPRARALDLQLLAAGDALYAQLPAFSWNSEGGTYSMDWGDVDRDGDLDLITGSAAKVAVYMNVNGTLSTVPVWSETRKALGVRWFAPPASEGEHLDALVVGESIDGLPSSQGTIRVYSQPEDSAAAAEITVPAQLLRVEPADFAGDDAVDLIVSTNALEPPGGCNVLLYVRSGGTYLPPFCVSNEATASLAAADANRDGEPDLALGLYDSKEIRVFINTGGSLSISNSKLIDDAVNHIPYDLAWGDYNGDGWLDLAAAFPLEQEVRIYRSDHSDVLLLGFTLAHTVPTAAVMTPLAVEWADVDNDAVLELIVGDLPPTVVNYDPQMDTFSVPGVTPVSISGRLQEIRAIDADNDADLDVALANQYGPSQLYANKMPVLGGSLQRLADDKPGQDLAWGDYRGDDALDLALATTDGVLLYERNGASFVLQSSLGSGLVSGLAWGDWDNDADLDLATATPQGAKVYANNSGSLAAPAAWASTEDPEWASAPASAVAWADFDSDGRLDLAVGGSAGVRVYRHDGSRLATFPSFKTTMPASDLAWGDYNKDFYPDLAVAGSSGVQVYRNQIAVLTALWTAPPSGNARSVAWADYDGDGYQELVAGYYDGPANALWDNLNGSLSTSPLYINRTGKTTQVAWGDWDNDGDLDLAVANEGGKDLVYANVEGTLVLDLAGGLGWESIVISNTTGLAWGDADGDGDLDLGVTAADGSGWYTNNYAPGREQAPLPQNPPVLSLARPGAVDDGYFFSAAEVLGSPTNPEVHFQFYYKDPEGDPWTDLSFGFSDGGGKWQDATNVTWIGPINHIYSGVWLARDDDAVSEDARLRISMVHGTRCGPVQRAQTTTISPPFRVRGTDCIWPSGPAIDPPLDPVVGTLATFVGWVEEGSGRLTFAWDFGDGSTAVGQQVSHIYSEARVYTVRLTVTSNPVSGEFCPSRPVMTQLQITVKAAMASSGNGGQE